jgi:hypothetical protein
MNSVENCINLVACICAKDGVISQVEEDKMFELISKKYTDISFSMFDKVLDIFFESDEQLENYLEKITDKDLQVYALETAKISASIDGLEINENIALSKAAIIWGIEVDE